MAAKTSGGESGFAGVRARTIWSRIESNSILFLARIPLLRGHEQSSFIVIRRAFLPAFGEIKTVPSERIGILRPCGREMWEPRSIVTSAGVTRSQSRIASKRKRRNHFAAIAKEQRHVNSIRDFVGKIDKSGGGDETHFLIWLAPDSGKLDQIAALSRHLGESLNFRPRRIRIWRRGQFGREEQLGTRMA